VPKLLSSPEQVFALPIVQVLIFDVHAADLGYTKPFSRRFSKREKEEHL